jgi:Rrf2 family protein
LGDNVGMRVTAKADYAVRAVMELAGGGGDPVKRDAIVAAQAIPPKFLENILSELRHAGIVESQRGSEGGYWLSVPPEEITVALVMRAVEGPLASVRSSRPETLEYEGLAEPLQLVWVALRSQIRNVLDRVTIADLVSGKLPKEVIAMTDNPDAWISQ